jgi:hypothetical protein
VGSTLYNENDFIKAVKVIIKNWANANKLCDFVFGTVVSVSPLKVRIDQKLVLESTELIVGYVFRSSPPSINERVILLRQSGGQNFYMMDRG